MSTIAWIGLGDMSASMTVDPARKDCTFVTLFATPDGILEGYDPSLDATPPHP